MPDNDQIQFPVYVKSEWENGTTPLSADNMNHLEEGVYAATQAAAKALDLIKRSVVWATDLSGEFDSEPPEQVLANYVYRKPKMKLGFTIGDDIDFSDIVSPSTKHSIYNLSYVNATYFNTMSDSFMTGKIYGSHNESTGANTVSVFVTGTAEGTGKGWIFDGPSGSTPETVHVADRESVQALGGTVADIISGAQVIGKATKDADGNTISSTYGKLARGTVGYEQTWTGYNIFEHLDKVYNRMMVKGHMWFNRESNYNVDGLTFAVGAPTLDCFKICIGQTYGTYAMYSLPYSSGSYTIATTSDVSTAKSEALESAASTAQGKVDSLASAMDFSNGAFGTIVAALLRVTKMEVTNVETKSAQVEDQFIELLKGNTDFSYGSNYAGFIFANYDGTHDFFVGLYYDTLVLGDCVSTRATDPETNLPTGKVLSIAPPQDIPFKTLAVRADTSSFEEDDVVKAHKENGSVTFVSSGVNLTGIAQAEAARVAAELLRAGAELARASAEQARATAETNRFAHMPFPLTQVQYDHLKDDGWHYCVNDDGTWGVYETVPQIAVYHALYSSTVDYKVIDDSVFADMMATISEAKAFLENQVFVTPEQYAELENQGLIGDKNAFIEDEDLYEELTETIPAAEEVREENEEIRQAWLEYSIVHWPWSITQAEMTTLSADGVFGVHFAKVNNKYEPVRTVYATRALAQAANETFIFEMTNGVHYILED